MKCKACGERITTSVCSYCRAVDFELAKQALESAKKERLIQEKKAKLIDGVLIGLAVPFILLAFMGMIAITNPESGNSFRSDFPMVLVTLVFAAIPIIGVIFRQRNRRNAHINRMQK